MKRRSDYLLIPVELCKFALQKKFYSQTQLYIYLKTSCAGSMVIDNNIINSAAWELDKHPDSIKRYLNQLIAMNWIGSNDHSGIFFIRGFDRLYQLEGFKYKTAVEFTEKDLDSFKSFCVGALIGYLILLQKRKRRRLERNYGARSNPGHLPFFDYNAVPLAAVGKMINKSRSTVSRYLKLAKDEGYIDYTDKFQILRDFQPGDDLLVLLKPEYKRRGKLLVQQLPNEITKIAVSFRKRKNATIRGSI